MAKTSPNDVLARYGNWYHGDDDLFAHVLITRGGHGVLLFQGLQIVSAKSFTVPAAKLTKLRDLAKRAPVDWAIASYSGYNFITDPEGPNANELAVFGAQAGKYQVAPAGSEIALLVKAIAKID